MKKKINLVLASIIFLSALVAPFGKISQAVTLRNNSRYVNWIGGSVTTWGPGGSHRVYDVKTGQSERWDRQDGRGFLLHVRGDSYYASADEGFYTHDDRDIRRSRTGRSATPVNTDRNRYARKPDGSFYTIADYNVSASDIPQGQAGRILFRSNSYSRYDRVSVNRWEDGTSGAYFTVLGWNTESWRRADPRGYIMDIGSRQYYVRPGESVFRDSRTNYVFINHRRANQIPPT